MPPRRALPDVDGGPHGYQRGPLDSTKGPGNSPITVPSASVTKPRVLVSWRRPEPSGRMTKIEYLRRRTNHEVGLSGPQSIAYQEREIAKEEKALAKKKAELEAAKHAAKAA